MQWTIQRALAAAPNVSDFKKEELKVIELGCLNKFGVLGYTFHPTTPNATTLQK